MPPPQKKGRKEGRDKVKEGRRRAEEMPPSPYIQISPGSWVVSSLYFHSASWRPRLSSSDIISFVYIVVSQSMVHELHSSESLGLLTEHKNSYWLPSPDTVKKIASQVTCILTTHQVISKVHKDTNLSDSRLDYNGFFNCSKFLIFLWILPPILFAELMFNKLLKLQKVIRSSSTNPYISKFLFCLLQTWK